MNIFVDFHILNLTIRHHIFLCCSIIGTVIGSDNVFSVHGKVQRQLHTKIYPWLSNHLVREEHTARW